MREKKTGTPYRIVMRSELGERYAAAFDGMHMETGDGQTILTGEVKDQPHLFGILDRVQAMADEVHKSAGVPGRTAHVLKAFSPTFAPPEF
jgi:hypothetical protein